MKKYDAIVIGAGHAGVEAALSLARTNQKTLLLTLSLDAIGFLACNPSIGGTAKGQLVSEIDALGGEMGINADKATNDSNNQKITSTYIKNISVSGRTVTITRGDGTSYTQTTQDTTYTTMVGATASKAGAQGFVPAPAAGKNTSFLRGDATWVLALTSINNVVPDSLGNITVNFAYDTK